MRRSNEAALQTRERLLTAALTLFGKKGYGATTLEDIVFAAQVTRGALYGALMASVLGWLLTKSVLETNGIFWAWMIHFVQDVVIFSGIILGQLTKLDHDLEKSLP